MKTKIMFDSNIYDILSQYIDVIKKSTNQFEYYVSSIQIDELCDIPDEKKEVRKRNMLMLVDLYAKLIPTACFALEYVRLGYAELGPGNILNNIINEKKSNEKDAIIADTAVKNGCILVTQDIRLYNKMKSFNYPVQNMEEFLASIQ